MSTAGWQSLARWAELRAGQPDPARLPGGAAARATALSDGVFLPVALPETSRRAHAVHAASPARDATGRGVKPRTESAVPALALPAKLRGPKEEGIAHAAPRPLRDADPGGAQGVEGVAPVFAIPARGQGPDEKDMARAELRTHQDLGHGGGTQGSAPWHRRSRTRCFQGHPERRV